MLRWRTLDECRNPAGGRGQCGGRRWQSRGGRTGPAAPSPRRAPPHSPRRAPARCAARASPPRRLPSPCGRAVKH